MGQTDNFFTKIILLPRRVAINITEHIIHSTQSCGIKVANTANLYRSRFISGYLQCLAARTMPGQINQNIDLVLIYPSRSLRKRQPA